MPQILSKLKDEKFQFRKMLKQTLCRLAHSCPFHLPFPSYCDVAQARSYFASTVYRVVMWRETEVATPQLCLLTRY
jgi:hypothetical protein